MSVCNFFSLFNFCKDFVSLLHNTRFLEILQDYMVIMNNLVIPDKEGAMESSSNEDNGGQLEPSGNNEAQHVTKINGRPEDQPRQNTYMTRQNTDMTDGGDIQAHAIRSGPCRNRPQLEDEVPDCFSNTRQFSRVISPTETKIKKRKLSGIPGLNKVQKMLKTERPKAIAEQEEDFFEQLFESSLEVISDDEEEEQKNSETETRDGYQDDSVFEDVYQKNRNLIQNGKDTGRRKSTDDDNTTSPTESHEYKQQGHSTTVFEDSSAAEGTTCETGGGILQRHPSPTKRQLNVHFNNEVSVETFPDADPEGNETRTPPAHGDGPPDNIQGTSIPLSPLLPLDMQFAARSDNTSGQTLQNIEKSGKENGDGQLEYDKAEILQNLDTNVSLEDMSNQGDSQVEHTDTLSDELSLSTWGTLDESETAVTDEQGPADIGNGKRNKETNAFESQGQEGMFPTKSTEYDHDNSRRDSGPGQ